MSYKIENLHKSFQQPGKRIDVLKGINLEVKEGEQISIVGKSGAGKSTLLGLMSGLDKADSGEVYINDIGLTKLSESELSKLRSQNMGIVFQRFHLIEHLSAYENVKLALNILGDEKAHEKTCEVLKDVGLADRMHHQPRKLSGGENQRVAIARAIATNPKIILADEPSGNLDQATGELVMGLLFDLCRKSKTTLILVTHDEDLAKRTDRCLLLSNGVLSAH